jgi:antitoxin (DNA-binding transcriptional repressor) of toxin-antitoxin stability system
VADSRKKSGRGQGRSDRSAAAQPAESDRVTYRELRNTPSRVWERLARDEPLTLVADGQAKALLIPIPDGDAASAHEAYLRGRALLAVRRIQDAARQGATGERMSLDEINGIIREVRAQRREQTGSST